jgi:hypothetical protein
MSVYVFERDGEQVEREYRIGTAPQSIRVNRKVYRRVISMPVVAMADHVSGRDVRFVANSLDPKLYKYHRGEFVKSHGESVPAINGRHEIDAIERRAADDGHHIKYGAAADSYRKHA